MGSALNLFHLVSHSIAAVPLKVSRASRSHEAAPVWGQARVAVARAWARVAPGARLDGLDERVAAGALVAKVAPTAYKELAAVLRGSASPVPGAGKHAVLALAGLAQDARLLAAVAADCRLAVTRADLRAQ